MDRHTFLSTAAKVAGGLAVGGALAERAAGAARAAQPYTRSFNITGAATVTLSCAWFGNANEAKALQAVYDKFTAKNPTIKVNVQAVANGSWGGYFDKIITMIAGGASPDIGRLATEGVLLAGTKSLVLPLGPLVKGDSALDEYFADVPAKLTDSLRYKGQLLGLTNEWNELMITYNTKMFKKAGIPMPGPDWTGDDFLAAAKKLQSSGTYGYIGWTGGTFFITGWMKAAGGELYNKDFTKSNATDPENVKAMQFLQDLIYKYKVAARPNGQDFALQSGGRVGMVSAGRWAVNTYEVSNFHDYNVQLMPKLSPNRKVQFGVGAQVIWKGSKYPHEALQALKYVVSREAMSVQTKLGNSNPSRKSLANDPALALPPGVPSYNYKSFFDALDAAEPVPAPPQFAELEVALNAGYSKLIANEVSAADMLKALDPQLNTILAKTS
jgi:ABC-type glycerol-3-phosphate transport system substrate-binding protein